MNLIFEIKFIDQENSEAIVLSNEEGYLCHIDMQASSEHKQFAYDIIVDEPKGQTKVSDFFHDLYSNSQLTSINQIDYIKILIYEDDDNEQNEIIFIPNSKIDNIIFMHHLFNMITNTNMQLNSSLMIKLKEQDVSV